MVIKRLAFLLISFLVSLSYSAQNQRIIFKVKPEYRLKCEKNSIQIPTISQKLNELGLRANKLFPHHRPQSQKNINRGKVDISSIYHLDVDETTEVQEILRQLRKDKHIAYAELEVENRLTYQPNDSLNYLQWYLEAVRAFEAWDIEQGDTSVVIAIIDSGTDLDHPDLLENLYLNHDDPINNIDDDGDGYIDNYFGWDVYFNDNNVEGLVAHGTNVAGIASASTDNLIGVSGCGFKAKLMTIKAVDESGFRVPGGYEGIVYAADQGADIINCSWGSYSSSQLGEDIVNYAAINHGALIVCGAGNGPFSGPNIGIGIEERFYPAAYENAMAIGSLDTGGVVKLSSNYGYWLQIFAPGENMWTTSLNGQIGRNGGTSMAAPVVAGLAALIKAQKPNYTARQIEERILNSGREIEEQNDPKYNGKLGKGHVDFLNALADTNLAGIRFEGLNINDGQEDFVDGEQLRIKGDFVNYLKSSVAGTARIREMNNKVVMVNDQVSLPAINQLDTFSIDQNPFVLRIKDGLALNDRLEFEISISAGTYKKLQYFSIVVNNESLNLSNGTISLTIGSSGEIGYSGPNGNQGIGLTFKDNSSLLYEGSFLVGNSPSYVADKFRGVNGSDNDFNAVNLVRPVSALRAVAAGQNRFNDFNLSNPVKLGITQNTYLFDSIYSDQIVLFNYQIRNRSDSTINGLYAGLVMDWDILDYSRNRIITDSSRKMGISYSLDSNLLVGLLPLSQPELSKHYAIDNINGGAGGIDITDSLGFNTAKKYQMLSNQRDKAGFSSPNGNDIIDALSLGPYEIAADSTLSLSMAIVVANQLDELLEAADTALSIYRKLPIGLTKKKQSNPMPNLFPNPADEELYVQFNSSSRARTIQVFDLKGKMLIDLNGLDGQLIRLNTSSLKSGVYLLRIIDGKNIIQDKFVKTTN